MTCYCGGSGAYLELERDCEYCGNDRTRVTADWCWECRRKLEDDTPYEDTCAAMRHIIEGIRAGNERTLKMVVDFLENDA